MLIQKAIRSASVRSDRTVPGLLIEVAGRLGMSVANLRRVFLAQTIPHTGTLEAILLIGGLEPRERKRLTELRRRFADRRRDAKAVKPAASP